MKIAVWSLVMLLAVPTGLLFYTGGHADAAPVPTAPRAPNTIAYSSSVDNWSLSYAEWLPARYTASHAYPLIVYLHGQQDTSGRWFPGGITSDLVQALGGRGPDSQTARLMVNTSERLGYILIALNTRSGSGWYINSPCGGPQEQDVLDAIAHEKALRHVSSTFLFGMSMGTEGTLYIAARHPGMFKAIGIIAPATDLFLDVAYRISLANDTSKPWAEASIQAKMYLFCGVLAGTENASEQAVARMYQNMSPLRFNPSAFARVPIYVTGGGWDDRTPNNVSIWPWWMNVNNTFINATCNSAPQLGEPAICSTAFDALHLSNPNVYRFRYIYEPRAGHVLTQLYPPDMLNFWQGKAAGGVYSSMYPFTSFVKDTTIPY